METGVVKNGELISFINSSFEVFEKHFRESFAKQELYQGFDMKLGPITEERIRREGILVGESRILISKISEQTKRKVQIVNMGEFFNHYSDLVKGSSEKFLKSFEEVHQIDKVFDNIRMLSAFLLSTKQRYQLSAENALFTMIEKKLLRFFRDIHHCFYQNDLYFTRPGIRNYTADKVIDIIEDNATPCSVRLTCIPQESQIILNHVPKVFEGLQLGDFSYFLYNHLPKAYFSKSKQQFISLFQELLNSKEEISFVVSDERSKLRKDMRKYIKELLSIKSSVEQLIDRFETNLDFLKESSDSEEEVPDQENPDSDFKEAQQVLKLEEASDQENTDQGSASHASELEDSDSGQQDTDPVPQPKKRSILDYLRNVF